MARKTLLTLMSLVLASVLTAPAANAKFFDMKELNEQKDAALRMEATGKWKQIHWRQTMDQALADAAKTQQPILVVFVVGKDAQKNAQEC